MSNKIHGKSKTPTYQIWMKCKLACYVKGAAKYSDTGAKGIMFSDSWLIFENFYRDMGDKPADKTLRRKDAALNYSKDNCYWGPRFIAWHGRTQKNYLEHKGERKSLADWSRDLGIPHATLLYRYKAKRPPEEILSLVRLTPIEKGITCGSKNSR